jgi:hypothetical protein
LLASGDAGTARREDGGDRADTHGVDALPALEPEMAKAGEVDGARLDE